MLVLFAGGGSHVADGLNVNASIERHVGDSDGYIVIEMEEEDEGTYYYTYSGEKESFEAPEAGDYEVIAVGGRGGSCNNNLGGYGAKASGTFRLSEGDRLNIVVGGKGGDCNRKIVFESLYSGAGGAGATYVELEKVTSETPELLLAAGGGGGAGKNFSGEDGQDGPSGGFDWGGKDGQGGRLCRDSKCSGNFFLIGGAGGGGYEGNGDSRCGNLRCDCTDDKSYRPVGPFNENEGCKEGNVIAEGGESFQNGSKGGQEQFENLCQEQDKAQHGGFGGFGGGAQGGPLYLGVCNSGAAQENGGGGGAGGYSGGGGAEFQGMSGGGQYISILFIVTVPVNCPLIFVSLTSLLIRRLFTGFG